MTENRQPYALVFGVSVFDICGFTDRNYRCNDSNPGKVKTSFGGVCRNIAECMARVGVNTKFISILGDDETGSRMMEHSKIMNYDMSESLVVKGGHTPTYMAILDEQGEMVSAVVDMKIIDMFTTDFIDSKTEIIRNSEYMILDSDRPDIVEYIIKTFSGNTKFILDPVSAAKAKTVKHLIKYFHTIKPNRYEAEIMCGFKIKNDEDLRKAGKYFIDLGIKNAEYMILDSDRPDIVEYIIKTFSGNTKFILDPVSAAKAKNVKHLIKHFHTIKPNRYEAEIMCGFKIKNDEDLRKAGKYFVDLGIENVFITLDEDGIYYNNGIEEGKIKANNVSVVNVTGAGDSFVAGIANGYMNNKNIVETVKYAISMSTITISTEETIHPDMSHELVKEYMDKIDWTEVKYNK